jgi:hypothetical protein
MEIQINNLKNQFVKIVESIQQIISFFEKLESKIANINDYYIDLIEKNKDKMYVFSLDSFKFQIALLDREFDENKMFFKVINNRIYCEYYKFCKTMCEYILENYVEPSVINVAKAINETALPVYDAVDPKKEYGLCFVLTIHDNIIELFKTLYIHLQNKESELKEHSVKKRMGFNIDNFVFTFDYNNSVIRDKLKMFLEYMHFFHKMHFKNLNLIGKKLLMMSHEIDNDLSLDSGTNDNDSDIESSISSDEGEDFEDEKINEASVTEKKRERMPHKKNLLTSPKINIFLKKKQTDNELISSEDKGCFSLKTNTKMFENIGLAIQEKGKKKNKTKNSSS